MDKNENEISKMKQKIIKQKIEAEDQKGKIKEEYKRDIISQTMKKMDQERDSKRTQK